MSRRGFGKVMCLAQGLVLLPILSSSALAADGGVDGFRSQVEKWVETRQLVSEEKSDWQVEQQLLRSTRDLLKKEKEALVAEIAELEQSNTASDDERRDLLLQRGEYQRANATLEEQIRAMEEEVLALVPQLPATLRNKLEPLLVQIPEDPENVRTPLGQRLMNVLGALAQAEKFNATATFVSETRSVGGEEKVQVRTLYWGLGQALYVDAQGQSAGVGKPGPQGWEFSEDASLVDDVSLLLDIYEGNTDTIEFVEMPVEIQ